LIAYFGWKKSRNSPVNRFKQSKIGRGKVRMDTKSILEKKAPGGDLWIYLNEKISIKLMSSVPINGASCDLNVRSARFICDFTANLERFMRFAISS
jgi:hypothetical protein